MKSKSDLKKKVLCSLLAASTLGIFYSNDALAAALGDSLVQSVRCLRAAPVSPPKSASASYATTAATHTDHSTSTASPSCTGRELL